MIERLRIPNKDINIGGQMKIFMKDLILYLEYLGLQDVVAYIQSSDIIFNSEKDRKELQLIIQDKIEQEYGFSV